MEPLVGAPIHHLQKLRTVHMDWVRRCPIQSVDPDHYGEDGACLCTTKRTKMTKQAPVNAAEEDFKLPPKTIISTIMRPPPGRTRVRH